jgi:hypothetical protein
MPVYFPTTSATSATNTTMDNPSTAERVQILCIDMGSVFISGLSCAVPCIQHSLLLLHLLLPLRLHTLYVMLH